jgi:glutathione S-transferase
MLLRPCTSVLLVIKDSQWTAPHDARAEPWFLKICPNGRIPALIDHDEGDLNVWESGKMHCWQPRDVPL